MSIAQTIKGSINIVYSQNNANTNKMHIQIH